MKKSLAIIAVFAITNLFGQVKSEPKKEVVGKTEYSFLKGLKKLKQSENGMSTLTLDNTTTVYTETGEKVVGMKMIQMLKSGAYLPQTYVDENEKVKAMVLVKKSNKRK